MLSFRSNVPNHDGSSRGVLEVGWSGSYFVSLDEDDSMVKSQYGRESFGSTS